MKFININGRILDYDKYRREYLLLGKLFEIDLRQYFAKFGFEKEEDGVFYSENLDVEVKVVVKKRRKEAFV